VVDTESKLSITDGQLSFAGGKATPAYGNPGIWYPSTARAAGKLLLGTFVSPASTGQFLFGWDTDQSSLPTTHAFNFTGYTNEIQVYENGANSGKLFMPVASTTYQMAVVLRGTGAYYYMKGGTLTNWTLMWIGAGNSTTPLYPGIQNYSSTFTADNIRIPTTTWLPTPLAYDTFTRADGAIGNSETTGPDSQTTPSLAWTGGAISTNKNVITPSLGSPTYSETFDSGTGGFNAYPNNTIENDTGTLKNTYVNNGNGTFKTFGSLTIGNWYEFSTDVKTNAGSTIALKFSLTGINKPQINFSNTTFSTSVSQFRASTIPISSMFATLN